MMMNGEEEEDDAATAVDSSGAMTLETALVKAVWHTGRRPLSLSSSLSLSLSRSLPGVHLRDEFYTRGRRRSIVDEEEEGGFELFKFFILISREMKSSISSR